MNRKTITTCATVALALALAATPAFAKSQNFARNNANSAPWEQFHNGGNRMNMPCPMDGNMPFPMDGNKPFPMAMLPQKDGALSNPSLLGTISAISDDFTLLTVKNADGNEVKVHINPLTKIREKDLSADSPDSKDNRDRRNAMQKKTIEPKDIKVGDWVAVKKIDTDTKTLEARSIIVVNK